MRKYSDCYYCCGRVVEKRVEWDYRRRGRHLIFQNVPAGVCTQCGEKFFRPDISKKMDRLFHGSHRTGRWVKVPLFELKAA